MTPRELHVRVTGRVQGVGFRYFVREAAEDLGLRGWVRNANDGSVEVAAIGPDADVESLLQRLRRGPQGAHVDKVEPLGPTGENLPEPFMIRH